MAKTTPRGKRLDSLSTQSWEMAPSSADQPGINYYPADGWSRIGLSWSSGFGVFKGWYVNLQRPLVPSRFGLDSMDLLLDIVVTPDGAWSWRDEVEFAEGRHRGLMSADEERAIKAHGVDVLRMLDERGGPFAEEWVAWRPPEDWTLPALPPDFAVV
jgi:protein associated with RNAse G/E